MVVLSITTCEATVGQKDSFPHHGIVVVMVVPDKHTHHITGLFHGSEHARIQFRSASLFHAGTYQYSVLVRSGFVIFRQRDMEECQCRQRLPTVLCFISGTLLAVPVHLVESEPVVPLYVG